MIAGEIAKEGLVTATAKSTAEWIEHKLGINVEKFTEHVAVEVVAKLIVTAVLGLAFFFASRGIWRATYRKFRAATIRKTASASFVIVRCPIANDIDNAIGNEIGTRLETAFRAFAGKANTRPFHVMTFPLALSGDDGTKAYDAAIETAKRWLERTNGNILIWGKRVKGDSVGVIRLIGRDRKTGTIEVRRVDFDKRATDFDQALANAIAYEAAQLTQIAMLEPERVHLDLLREVSDKLKRLAASDAPALSNKWRERMAEENWRLTEEIVRRTSSEEERGALEAQARLEIVALDPVKQPRRFAETALRVGTLVRKRSWVDPDPAELDEAHALLSKAGEIFESIPDIQRAAEAALERAKIRRQRLVFLTLLEAQNDNIYDTDIREAQRLIELAGNEGLKARLTAESCTLPDDDVIKICSLDQKGPLGAFELTNLVSRYLDNCELADLATDLSGALSYYGTKSQDAEFWRAAPQLVEAILNSRSHWTTDERKYLDALTAGFADVVALRLSLIVGSEAAAPFIDIRNRLTAKILDSFELKSTAIRRYIDFRTLQALSDSEFKRFERVSKSLEAQRICAGPSAERFPQLQGAAKKSLIVALNNRASHLNLPEAAEEALRRSLELEHGEIYDNDLHYHYISAYASWQAARLTPLSDPGTRADRSIRAHSFAEKALKLASEEANRHYMTTVDSLLNEIENDFPELAAVSQPTDAVAGKDSELPPDSPLTN